MSMEKPEGISLVSLKPDGIDHPSMKFQFWRNAENSGEEISSRGSFVRVCKTILIQGCCESSQYNLPGTQ